MEGKRSRGRKKKIWIDNVMEDLKEKDIDDQDLGGDQKQRVLEESCKCLSDDGGAHIRRIEDLKDVTFYLKAPSHLDGHCAL